MRALSLTKPAIGACWRCGHDAKRRKARRHGAAVSAVAAGGDRERLETAEAALRAQVSAVRSRRPGFEAGPVWRALHGDCVEEVERAVAPEAAGVRYSTEPAPVVGRRVRYGGLARLSLDDATRAAADRLVALHEACERLGAVRGCLAEAKRGGEDRSDATRAGLVRGAAAWRRAVAALSAERRRLGGVLVSEREVVVRVVIDGAALSRCHGGVKALSGKALACAKEMLCAGVARAVQAAGESRADGPLALA